MKPLKPFDVLQKLIANATARFHRMSASKARNGEADRGKPGEMLEYLSQTEREVLQNLTADDTAIEKLPFNQVWFLVDNENWYSPRYYDIMLHDEKIEFDKKLLNKIK